MSKRRMAGLVVALVAAACVGGAMREQPSAAVRRDIDTSLFVSHGRVGEGLVKEIQVAASPREVFEAWTTSEGIQGFLGVESTVELAIGGAMELYFGRSIGMPVGEQGSEGCQVLSYVPDEMFSFSWNAPPKFPEERTKRSWVVVTMRPVDGGTLVRLRHVGFGEDGHWGEVEAYFDRAWTNVLQALKEHLEK